MNDQNDRRPTGGHSPELKRKYTMSAITLENAIAFVETNFVAPEIENRAAQNAGLLVNPYAEFNAIANAEALCHADSLRDVDVGKGGYKCPISGHSYTKGKAGTKDNALYKRLMDAQNMTAFYDLQVAVVLNAIKKFADGAEVSKENCAAFYADEKSEKKIAKLFNVRSLANAVKNYAPKNDSDTGGNDTDTDTDTGGNDDTPENATPPASEFVGQYAAAIAKAQSGEIDAFTAKTILAALQNAMEKEFLKTAGITAKAWQAAQQSKIKKTA
jgi:hypothetical protein